MRRLTWQGTATVPEVTWSTFPLPVEDLLQQLQEHVDVTSADALPRSGKQLADVFRVVLKTNKTGKTTQEEIKTLIHQARVRRQVGGSKKNQILVNQDSLFSLSSLAFVSYHCQEAA